MTHCHVISGAAKTKALQLRRCLATATYKDKASSLLLLLLPVGKMSPSPGPAGLRWPHSSVGPMWDAFGCSPSAEPLQPALGCHQLVPGLRPAPPALGSWCAGTPRPLLQLPPSSTHQLRADLMDFHLLTSPSGLFLMSFLVFLKKKPSSRSAAALGTVVPTRMLQIHHIVVTQGCNGTLLLTSSAWCSGRSHETLFPPSRAAISFFGASKNTLSWCLHCHDVHQCAAASP